MKKTIIIYLVLFLLVPFSVCQSQDNYDPEYEQYKQWKAQKEFEMLYGEKTKQDTGIDAWGVIGIVIGTLLVLGIVGMVAGGGSS